MRPVSPLRRAVSLLLGCWLAVFAAEPAAIHTCPVHDVGQQASHASHHRQQSPGHHTCTCPGACCPVARAQLATTPTIVPPRVVTFVEPYVAVAVLLSDGDIQVSLPPALGPPAISG